MPVNIVQSCQNIAQFYASPHNDPEGGKLRLVVDTNENGEVFVNVRTLNLCEKIIRFFFLGNALFKKVVQFSLDNEIASGLPEDTKAKLRDAITSYNEQHTWLRGFLQATPFACNLAQRVDDKPKERPSLTDLPTEVIGEILDRIESPYDRFFLRSISKKVLKAFYTPNTTFRFLNANAVAKSYIQKAIHRKQPISTLQNILTTELMQSRFGLDLQGINFSPSDLQEIAQNFPNLYALYLHECDLTDEYLLQLPCFTTLTVLDLHIEGVNRSLEDHQMAFLKNLKNLECLNLSGHDRLERGTVGYIESLEKLKTLSLDVTHIAPESLDLLPASLETLTLYGASDDHVAHIRHLKNLKKLSLKKTEKVMGVTLEHLPDTLEFLNVAHCNIQDDSISHLCRLIHLKSLDLSGNVHLKGTSFGHLSPNLEVFHAAFCPLTSDAEKYVHQINGTGNEISDVQFLW